MEDKTPALDTELNEVAGSEEYAKSSLFDDRDGWLVMF